MNLVIPEFKQVLLISPEFLDGHFVSKHHYAITLASQGCQVYFLGPPQETDATIKINKTQYENIFDIKASKIARGLRFYPAYLKRKVEKKWLERLENLIGDRFTTIWLFENSRFYDLGFAKEKLKIYHQVDSNQSFHISNAASSADICFCTTDFIKKTLLLFNEKVFKIHHGVSSDKSERNLNKTQADRFIKYKVNVVLIGNLDIKYLDLDLLESLISLYPQICFHLIGGYKEEGLCYSKCSHFENAIWWGKVGSEIIPVILSHCDATLLLYKAETKFDIEQLASPHKLMEYLASGKVTVTTYTDEYKDKSELLEMVDNNSDYLSKFNDVISNLVYYNSAEKQNQRKLFANEHTYSKQLGKIMCHLKTNNLID
jgi:glycosyltransferase involved in cell wall biosynthesis